MLCNLGKICYKMDPRPPFHLYKEKSFTMEKYYFCVQSQNSTLSRFTSNLGLFVHIAQSVANNILKNLNSHKMTKFFGGVLGP